MTSKRTQSQPAGITAPPLVRAMPVARLSRAAPTAFDLQPDTAERAAIAACLGLVDLRKMRFRGELVPAEHGAWRLVARLTADLSQACVATLEPVPARIDQTIRRDFLPGPTAPGAATIDLDPDAGDAPDFFEATIDPGQVAVESLALALDAYPRAPGAGPVEMHAAPPGAEPMDDDAAKPFAGLAALRSKLEGH